jgi:hypothetical protein
LLFGALALRFFQPQDVERKHCFIKRTPKSWRPDVYVARECTPAIQSIQFFCEGFEQKVWRQIFMPLFSVAHTQHRAHGKCGFLPGIDVAPLFANDEHVS